MESREVHANAADYDKTILLPKHNTATKPISDTESGLNDAALLSDISESASNDRTTTGLSAQSASLAATSATATINSSRIGPGAVLNHRYELLEKIGAGGMGTVYKALDRRDIEAGNSAFIAIKVLNDEFRSDPDLLKALHSEARKTQTLAHPNILTVYDFDRDGQTVFMTMEYMEGATLDKIIRQNPAGLKKTEVLAIVRQICSALAYAHARGIIHSDFKPANVFVDIGKRVKILDFGIARLQHYAHAAAFDAGILGANTPAYATLEMLSGAAPDPRDDIYALACVTYELLTGAHPFNRERIDNCAKKQLQAKRMSSLNNAEWNALSKALNFQREKRTESVSLFLHGMENKRNSAKPILIAVSIALLTGLTALVIGYGLLPFKISSTFAEPQTAIEKENSQPSIPAPSGTIVNHNLQAPPGIGAPIVPTAGQTIAKQSAGPGAKSALPVDTLDLSVNKKQFKIGEQLIVEFTVDKPLFVHIAVVNSSGEVTVIYPNAMQKDSLSIPETHYQIPPEESDATLDIFGPAGEDKLVAIASDEAIDVNETDFVNLERFANNNRVITKILKYSISS